MKKLMQILMLLLVLFPIAGYCGDWELMDNPLSNTGVTLDSIWGSGNDDVYVVGGNVILHFNGRQWRIQSISLRDFGRGLGKLQAQHLCWWYRHHRAVLRVWLLVFSTSAGPVQLLFCDKSWRHTQGHVDDRVLL